MLELIQRGLFVAFNRQQLGPVFAHELFLAFGELSAALSGA
ncbi:MAG: hypothetical protein R3F11_17690 [Verrucomicrobiales bacterium]